MSDENLAEAARALVGTRFRLNGRDPEHGLDCIGLLEAALAAAGHRAVLPQGYGLRMTRLDGWLPDPASLGFTSVSDSCRAGDVLLLTIGPGQYHLAIAGQQGRFIHAHAGLRRVVESPTRPTGTALHHWRLVSN